MYRKIVIAYDGTEDGKVALHHGLALAHGRQVGVTIMGIVVTSGGLLLDPAVVSRDLIDTEQRLLRDALDSAAQEATRMGVMATTVLRDGDAAHEIAAYAREVHADLVVVGHGHKGLLARWLEGSVGTQLLAAMPCSLLVASDPVA